MPLGPAKWIKHRPFYENLTLANGDLYEAVAYSKYNLGDTFPAYTRFWKFHVCPATTRPHGIELRQGHTTAIVSTIVQRSHAVMRDLVRAHDDLELVRAGYFGSDEKNAEQVFLYAGNALQKTYDFAAAISPMNRSDFQGQPSLADQLGLKLVPFPDWLTMWADDRNRAGTYRHYLTHQGAMFKVHKGGQVFVPSRTRFENRKAITWTQHIQDYENNPADWVEIGAACEDVVKETIAFLELAYERFCDTFDPLLPNPDYQHHWGWRPGVDPLGAPRPRRGVTVGLVQSRIVSGTGFQGSTATRVEESGPIRPSDGPDPSGVRRL